MSRISSKATSRPWCIKAWLARLIGSWQRFDAIQSAARASPSTVKRSRWPMIVFRTPKGWTGPKFVDGLPVEGTWRAHQVPIADFKNPEHVGQLEDWMKSYRPRELFDESGKFRDELAALAPRATVAWE